MANDLNQCNFIGRLGKDPETRPFGDTSVCSFSIAIGSKWKNKKGETQERTEWVNVSAWGKLGEICQQYLEKGKQCFVSGQMKTDKYADKDTGKDRYSTQIVASNIQLLGSGQAPQQSQQAPQVEAPSSDFSDEIPF